MLRIELGVTVRSKRSPAWSSIGLTVISPADWISSTLVLDFLYPIDQLSLPAASATHRSALTSGTAHSGTGSVLAALRAVWGR